MKKIALLISCLFVIAGFVISPGAIASKPKLGFVEAGLYKNKVTVYFSVSRNVNSLRVVQCLGKQTKKPVGCKGKKIVKKPKQYCKKTCYWRASFRARQGMNIGYVVASNSDGSTKKIWAKNN